MRRAGIIGGTGAVVAIGIVLAAYEVQSKTMPEWLFWSVVVLGLIVILVGGGAWAVGIIVRPILQFVGAREFRWVRKDAPDPNQWLIDIAKADEDNPAATVQVLSRRIIRWTLDVRRPFLQFGVTVFNGSVHNVVFSGVDGPITFNGEPLETAIEFEGGATRITRGQSYELRVRQYIPSELVEEVHNQLSASVVSSFGLSSVVIEVRADVDDAQPVRMTIGGNDQLAVGN